MILHVSYNDLLCLIHKTIPSVQWKQQTEVPVLESEWLQEVNNTSLHIIFVHVFMCSFFFFFERLICANSNEEVFHNVCSIRKSRWQLTERDPTTSNSTTIKTKGEMLLCSLDSENVFEYVWKMVKVEHTQPLFPCSMKYWCHHIQFYRMQFRKYMTKVFFIVFLGHFLHPP